MNRVARRRWRVGPVPIPDGERGPSDMELAEIEAEMPLIEAEVAVVDAEAALAVAPDSEVAWRQHRRAKRRVLAATRALVREGTPVRSSEVA